MQMSDILQEREREREGDLLCKSREEASRKGTGKP